jgi:RNA polymerase sigma-70 factor, ECF subfamily
MTAQLTPTTERRRNCHVSSARRFSSVRVKDFITWPRRLLDVLDNELRKTIGDVRRQFLVQIAPLRPDLHRYCRRLTGDIWDAEDLLQETLARAFTAAAQSHQQIERPMAWLLRIASNTYIDWTRKPAPSPAPVPDTAVPPAADPAEVRDALAEVATHLPPQERAALVLKDVFDLPLAEIAAMVGTSVGAVKAALHRGRGRLADPDSARAYRPKPDRAVVDALASAFTAYDLDRLAGLLLADCVVEVVGAVREVGREQARTGSLHHTLVLETHVRYRAEVRELAGEPLVLLFGTPTSGDAPEALEDVLRVETEDGGVQRLRWYYFCTETLSELAEHWGVTTALHQHPSP